ncbi:MULTISPECIES: hypothetical protein [Nocardiaceae]|uniref:hypothetical protein n=1 Tax=Nocardiaceae TaxID=85025 RepID=UPI00056BAD64|nr:MULTISPECIES: hypothetical protein [Rhodococcus]OZD12078.1 hypothetical protein CH248_29190 [Rhodococcus sp. 06-156-4a]OZD15747.1 hypothetical protein CH253_22530 [Rhodococcus sp. 06-156-3C]OZD21131.1 hypothetical protein CH280_02760 [Rhodococcus sp. 06-156-4C]OZD32314.1 hypothetical protein CH284_20690 [Rhodococcus sp. 06-156-3]OZD36535.1 hypothetical protein CH247_03115 [Rhodococcus sp. 06-156-3b]
MNTEQTLATASATSKKPITKAVSDRTKLIAYTLAGIATFALALALMIWIITPTEPNGNAPTVTTAFNSSAYWIIVAGSATFTGLGILALKLIDIAHTRHRQPIEASTTTALAVNEPPRVTVYEEPWTPINPGNAEKRIAEIVRASRQRRPAIYRQQDTHTADETLNR